MQPPVDYNALGAIAEYEARLQREAMQEDAERLTASFRDFHREAVPILDPGIALIEEWYLDAIRDHFEWWARGADEGGIKDLLVRIRPRMLKTLSLVALVAWGMARNQTLPWLGATHNPERQKEIVNAVRRLVKSDWYQARWPVGMADAQDEATRFKLETGGQLYSANYGTSALGDGGDRLFLDDPQTWRDLLSAAQCEKDWGWHESTWRHRRNDPRTSGMLYISQQLPYGDNVGDMWLYHYPGSVDQLLLQTRKTVVHVRPIGPEGAERDEPLIDTMLSRERGFADTRAPGEYLSRRIAVKEVEAQERADPKMFSALEQQVKLRGTATGAAFGLFNRDQHVKRLASWVGGRTVAESIAKALEQGWQAGVRFDHGTGAGRQWMGVDVWSNTIQVAVQVGEYVNARVAPIHEHAQEMARLLQLLGLAPRMLSLNIGDVGKMGMGSDAPARDVNEELGRLLGITIRTPRKGRGSVQQDVTVINLALGSGGLYVSPDCPQTIQCLENWRLGKEEFKDGADQWRYGAAEHARRWQRREPRAWGVAAC